MFFTTLIVLWDAILARAFCCCKFNQNFLWFMTYFRENSQQFSSKDRVRFRVQKMESWRILFPIGLNIWTNTNKSIWKTKKLRDISSDDNGWRMRKFANKLVMSQTGVTNRKPLWLIRKTFIYKLVIRRNARKDVNYFSFLCNYRKYLLSATGYWIPGMQHLFYKHIFYIVFM